MTIFYPYEINSTNYNPTTTTFYWRVVSRGAGGGGTAGVVVDDFDTSSGSTLSAGNTTAIYVGVKEQTGTQGTRNFTLEVSTSNTFASNVVTKDFQVTDGAAAAPTYTIQGSDPLTVSEVASAQTITVNTTDVSDGTFLYWNITTDAPGTTQASTDWQAYNSGGSGFEITSNSGTFDIDATADAFTDGSTETFYLHVRTGSDTGTSVDSIELQVTDDSQTPASATFSFDPTFVRHRRFTNNPLLGCTTTSQIDFLRTGSTSIQSTGFGTENQAIITPALDTANNWSDTQNSTFGDDYQILFQVYSDSGLTTLTTSTQGSAAGDAYSVLKGGVATSWTQSTANTWVQLNDDVRVQGTRVEGGTGDGSGAGASVITNYVKYTIKEYSGTLGTGTTVLTGSFEHKVEASDAAS